MNVTTVYHVIVLALATAAISVTVTKANVFSTFRTWILSKSGWFGELFSCAYCLSHWVALIFVGVYRPAVIEEWFIVDFVVSVFVIVALSALISGTLIKLIPFNGHGAGVRGVEAKPKGSRTRDYAGSSVLAERH